MNIKVLAKINGYTCQVGEESLYPFKFDNFMISNDTATLKQYFPEDFNRSYIGFKPSDYHHDYFVYFLGESASIPQLNNVINIGQMGELLLSLLNTYLIAIWFEKNCSVNINQCLVTDVAQMETSICSKGFFYTDAKGLYNSLSFKIRELKSAFNRLGELWNHFPLVSTEIIPESELKGMNANPSTSLPYKDLPRIGRALNFLDLARAQALLPLKISFYVVLLESLFTSTTSEVTHQVSERTALFVGTSKSDKKEIYKVVKKAYGFRSNYMHGQLVKKTTIEDFQMNSFQIDEIIRRLFLKILDGESEIFNEPETTTFDDYFRDLVFQ